MIVHRLKVWLARVLARAASLLSARAQPHRASAPARTLITVGTPTAHRSGLASSQWLADSRRLRARPAPPSMQPALAADYLRQILRDPRWAVAFDASHGPRPPRSASSMADPRASQQPTGPAPSRPLTSPSPAADAGTSAELAWRRLNFVRELVRRGIYNEGFDPRHLPDHYRPRPTAPDDHPPEPPRH
jgi:hypothetical protein